MVFVNQTFLAGPTAKPTLGAASTVTPFKVTSVAVAPAAAPGDKCNVTVDVVGTIVTNGKGGQVTYQWVRNGTTTSPVTTAVIGTGQTTAPVHLSWMFTGKGTYQATAELRVLTPEVATAKTTFTYSCR